MLVTTGRTPNIEGLGLAEHGIALSPKGNIVVDDRMRTTRAGVYAAGDVTGRDQFVYMAAYGAKLAVKNCRKTVHQPKIFTSAKIRGDYAEFRAAPAVSESGLRGLSAPAGR